MEELTMDYGEPSPSSQFYNVTQSWRNESSGGGVTASWMTELGLPLRSRVVLVVMYSVATLMSVVGNVFAIVVFAVGRGSRTDLRWFLINLGAADLIMAVFCMPFTFTVTMYGRWLFAAFMCPLVLFMQTVSVTVSVCTIVAIGIDRFWVVLFPLRSRFTRARSKTVVAVVWVIACSMSSVQLVVGRSNSVEVQPGVTVADCNEVWPEPRLVWRRAYTFFILVSTYVLPLVILALTYGFVSGKLWLRTAPGNADESRDNQQLRSKRKVIKMLVTVVTLFGVCWLPLHAFILVIDFHPDLLSYKTSAQKEFFVAVYYSVHWLAMSNSFVNPIIYGFLNDSFRSDLRWLLCSFLPSLLRCKHSDKDYNDHNGRRARSSSKQPPVHQPKRSRRLLLLLQLPRRATVTGTLPPANWPLTRSESQEMMARWTKRNALTIEVSLEMDEKESNRPKCPIAHV